MNLRTHAKELFERQPTLSTGRSVVLEVIKIIFFGRLDCTIELPSIGGPERDETVEGGFVA